MSKILCVFGEHQHGNPKRGLGTEYVAFLPALRRLGHEVDHYESWNRQTWNNLATLNENLIKKVLEFKPDVILAVLYSNELWLETLDVIRNLGVTTVLWTTDDSFKFIEHSRFYGKHFSLVTTTYDYCMDSYAKEGIKNVVLTQWGANQECLQSPRLSEACEFDVSFVGATIGNRKSSVAKLEKMGLKVECFGYGWPNGPVPAEKIPEIMNASKISLNFANSSGVNQIKARNFEVPGAGGFLLAEDAPGLERFYIPGTEIDTFTNLEELATKANYYLENPSIRDKVAMAGYQRTVTEHTYDQRFKTIMDYQFAQGKQAKTITDQDALNQMRSLLDNTTCAPVLKYMGNSFVKILELSFGNKFGNRVARKLVYEAGWRILGSQAYTSKSITGRVFGWIGSSLEC